MEAPELEESRIEEVDDDWDYDGIDHREDGLENDKSASSSKSRSDASAHILPTTGPYSSQSFGFFVLVRPLSPNLTEI